MPRKPTKTKTRNAQVTLADELNNFPSAPTNPGWSTESIPAYEEMAFSEEQERVQKLYEKLRSDVPPFVENLFNRWESDEFFPQDFQTEVAADSLESQVGYSSLYRQMHRDFQHRVAYYRSERGGALGIEEARAAAYHACTNGDEALRQVNMLLSLPLSDLNFVDLMSLSEAAPRTAEGFWELAKREGRKEFESGHLAANITFPVDYHKKLWNIAKYLGVRESFIDEWRPRGGIEVGLVDILAQTFFQFQYWYEQTVTRSHGRLRAESHSYMKWRAEQELNSPHRGQGRWDDGDWHSPTLSEAEALEQAVQMADRFHRMHVRTLKQMRDHRRYSPVLIASAGQVNIAADGGQQVNVNRD
jgi:hypothetical protein